MAPTRVEQVDDAAGYSGLGIVPSIFLVAAGAAASLSRHVARSRAPWQDGVVAIRYGRVVPHMSKVWAREGERNSAGSGWRVGCRAGALVCGRVPVLVGWLE